MAVTLAEPSGIFGLMKEGMASGMAVLKAKSDPGASELAKALEADMETSEGRSAAQDGLKSSLTGKTPDEIKQQVMVELTLVQLLIRRQRPTPPLSKRGSNMLQKRWRKQPPKEAFSASVASR